MEAVPIDGLREQPQGVGITSTALYGMEKNNPVSQGRKGIFMAVVAVAAFVCV